MAKFIQTLTVLQGVRALVEAMKVPESTTEKLFDLVRLYDSTEVDRAFADTLVSKERRLCFVLPGRDSFNREQDGRILVVKKRAAFALLVCDTDRKTGQEAVFGGAKNIGTVELCDILTEALAGETLGNEHLCIEPEDADDLSVSKDGVSDSGRKGRFLTFSTAAGKKKLTAAL